MNHGTYLIEDLNLMILMRSDIFYGCNSIQIVRKYQYISLAGKGLSITIFLPLKMVKSLIVLLRFYICFQANIKNIKND